MATQILSFSLSKEEAVQIDLLAEKQNRSRSQIIKEAVAFYAFELQWREIRTTGDRIAKKLGLESDDDVERLFG